MKKIFIKPLWITLTSVFGAFFITLLVGTLCILNYGYAAVNLMFGTSNIRMVNDDGAELSVFYESDRYERKADYSADEMFAEDSKVVEEVELEGATLLWNKDSALPLAGNEKVSCLSHSSVDIVKTGSGSGWIDTVGMNSSTSTAVTLKDALTSRGFTVNTTLWDFYATGAGRSYTRQNPQSSCTEGQTWHVHEVPWSVYTDTVKSSFATYNDLAIVVLSRTGGEYSDLHYSSTENRNGSSNGNYLALTSEEKQLLDQVKSYRNGTFKKVVLLLNTANPLEFSDIAPYYDSIDACMWIGQTGTTGINSVVDLLKGVDKDGKQVSPSGRLTDTYAYNNESAPATENDGSYMYAGDCSGLNEQGNGVYRQRMYMVYQEGIYVGYKYYETRYEDAINGEGGATSSVGAKQSASGWNYDEEVAFPFGYGLSYTTFAYSGFSAQKNGDNYEVTVNVKNNGSRAGKEVVQVYLQKPYTSYDKEYKIEKASVELAGYAKTRLLGAGEDENVVVTVPEEYFKTYDAEGRETYILEGGTYYLTVANDSHEAINNILAKQGKTGLTKKAMGENVASVTGAGFVQDFRLENDYNKYSKSTQTGYKITNQFNSGDWNKYAHKTSGEDYKYLSRSDWSGTYPATPRLTMNADLKEDLKYDRTPEEDPTATAPQYGTVKGRDEKGEIMASIKAGDLVAFQFIDAPLNPEREVLKDPEKAKDTFYVEEEGRSMGYVEYWNYMWDRLLDQMSFEDQALICSNAYHRLNGATSIALGESKQENGPVGITKRSDFPVPAQRSTKSASEIANMDDYHKDQLIDDYKWVAYPCAPVVAATYNNALVEKMGKSKGEDMLWLGYNGIYGPGVNMHRSPFGGRNFEYPSEDSLLAGLIGYYESKGIESKGCLAYAKHYALNDMETNRRHVGIWSHEQATREIYLRAFELTFAEGGARATMNSFTRVGARWNGACKEMMTTVLRDEWGFEGIVISDWDSGGSMSKVDGILGGTDSFDGNGTKSSFNTWKESTAVQLALREATKRIVCNVVKTNLMNGTSITTRYIKVTPWWETTLWALTIVCGVLAVLCGVMIVLSFTIFNNKKAPKAAKATATASADAASAEKAGEGNTSTVEYIDDTPSDTGESVGSENPPPEEK